MKMNPSNSDYILHTDRLRFRRMEDSDLDFVAKMLSCPEVMKYYPQTYNREESAQWLQRQQWRYQEYGHGLWLVENQQTNEPMGQIGVLVQEVEGDSIIEVGYLLDRPFWGQGYALEAASACKKYAFETLGAKTVHSLIRPTNIPSQRVAIRNGLLPVRVVVFKELEHLLFATHQPE